MSNRHYCDNDVDGDVERAENHRWDVQSIRSTGIHSEQNPKGRIRWNDEESHHNKNISKTFPLNHHHSNDNVDYNFILLLLSIKNPSSLRLKLLSSWTSTNIIARKTRWFMLSLLLLLLVIMEKTSATNFTHLRRSPYSSNSNSAEYFYAQDKLSDAQVEQFVQSLNQTTSQLGNNRNQNYRVTSGHQTLPSRSLSSLSSSRWQQHQPQQSFSLLTPKNISLDNILTAKYHLQSSPNVMNSSSQMIEKYYDMSQWLQPVYVAPKRPMNQTMNNFHNQSIVLFGSDMIENLSINDNSSIEIVNDSDSTLSTYSFLLANVTFELKDEQWVAPIIALSTLNMLVIIGFECFVVYRAFRTCPSRRHLFLGQMLLLGLFLSSATGLAFVPKSSWLSCTMIRIGLGISFALVYATLLVKSIFILSLHTGVYLSAEYQSLLLFFIISTQIAIDVQWIFHTKSSIVIDYWDGFGQAVYRCDHSTHQLLWSLSYVILLIVILAIMAFRIRGYRENHGEALFLGIVALSQIIIWLVWISGTLASTPHYRDGFVAFGVVGNATLVFMIMFLPKGRQLAAVGGRDVISGGAMDRIDQLSIASSPSTYTPSFLHIKTGNFLPLTKPTIGGYRNSVSGGCHSARSSATTAVAYHLYQKFHGTGNTLTSPTITTTKPDGGTNSTTITHPPRTMSNSFSSHAIFNFQQAERRSQDRDNEDDDPNYSNLSNIFTTSTTVAVTSSNEGSKTSPLSENISSHSSGSSNHNSNNNNNNQSGKAPSVPKSKRPQLKSPNDPGAPPLPLPRNAGGGFFYLQPPPLPPPPPLSSSDATAETASNIITTTATTTPVVSSSFNHSRSSWRQSCYTSNFGVNHRHYYPGPKSGSYHPSLPTVPSTPTGLTTPIGHMPPPQLISPTGNEDSSNNIISGGIASGFYLAQHDQQNNGANNCRQQTTNGTNFKYFRGQFY